MKIEPSRGDLPLNGKTISRRLFRLCCTRHAGCQIRPLRIQLRPLRVKVGQHPKSIVATAMPGMFATAHTAILTEEGASFARLAEGSNRAGRAISRLRSLRFCFSTNLTAKPLGKR